MTTDDIEVNLQNSVLAIRGEKKEEKQEGDKEPFLCERNYGSFQRVFTLPAPVDEGAVSADFKDGVLKIHMP